jgi:hypothetical protein
MTERKERLINAYHDVIQNWINKVSENETTMTNFRSKSKRKTKEVVLDVNKQLHLQFHEWNFSCRSD